MLRLFLVLSKEKNTDKFFEQKTVAFSTQVNGICEPLNDKRIKKRKKEKKVYHREM